METKIDGDKVSTHFDIKHAPAESIHDFHFFCLSIVKDLLTGQHVLDQYGKKNFVYSFEFDDDDIDGMKARMEHMANIILAERLDRKKSFDNLITDN